MYEGGEKTHRWVLNNIIIKRKHADKLENDSLTKDIITEAFD